MSGLPEWMEFAACAAVDPELWFAASKHEEDHNYPIAKATCQRCPVQAECLDAALRNDERYGVFGGLTPEERQALNPRGHRRPQQADAPSAQA